MTDSVADDEPFATDGGSSPGEGSDDATNLDETPEGEVSPSTDTPTRREVVVPLRLYKTITVFATMIAMVAVLVGFVLVDVGTDRAQAEPSEVNVVVVLLGLASIVLGAATYAFSTRFRTAEMGNAKDDTDEGSHNG